MTDAQKELLLKSKDRLVGIEKAYLDAKSKYDSW
jgi:hypothetical protein